MTHRSAFVSAASDLLDRDERVCVLLGDIGVWGFREAMEKHDRRVLNVGVAEQGMLGLGAGLAMAGFFPIIHTIESFMLRRAYEFIRLDFGEQRLPGCLVTVGAGDAYAKLGPTHQCPEAWDLLDNIPNMHIYNPVSDDDVGWAIRDAWSHGILGCIRLRG